MAEAYRRHDLLDVAPAAWAAALAERPDLDGLAPVAEWVGRGHPVIVRRRHPGEARERVPVGLPLPPRDGKRRIGLAVPPEAVRPRAPVRLAEASGAAPDAWAATIAAVVALGARVGAAPCLFGGLLWQHLTGLPYLSETSDLDLLWPSESLDRPALLSGLAAIEARAPMRLDGEILLPDGGGVNWREWHGAGPGETVLVKSLDRVALRDADAIHGGIR
ncbi:malonate decarboxylase holo-[acyl-carrier-protein] synthase [Methylobacterium sp. Leaf118]|uniref:malonate decarboxylase holo-[acyl-carrier-protein] synthase n=1 Tax=Methylobacterium sp. Leaf118 TaxID=2876562 RepID=UPI001E4FB731|nr:malonate decarboxylase holo-[acyl-carrier-protein] synthase [Methylobacterium sp. Leaf118]